MKLLFLNDAKEYVHSGILQKHFEGISKTSVTRNEIIIIRPVNSIAKNLIAEGYPTKSFKIKQKSSDWGIQSGFIISNENLDFLSKKGLINGEKQIDKIKKITADLNNKITNNKFIFNDINLKDNEMILEISETQYDFWIDLSEIKKTMYNILDVYKWDCCSLFRAKIPGEKGEKAIFYLQKNENNNYKVSYIFPKKLEEIDSFQNEDLKNIAAMLENEKIIYLPIIVFCQYIENIKKPIVPDYDLLTVMPSYDNYNYNNNIKNYKMPLPLNTDCPKRKKSINKYLYLDSLAKNDDDSKNQINQEDIEKIIKRNGIRPEDENFGNCPEFLKECLDILNKNVGYLGGKTDPLRVFHHNADFFSPFPQNDENAYFPCTIFLPNFAILNDFEISNTIENHKELQNKISSITKNNTKNVYFIIDSDNKQEALKFLNNLLNHFNKKNYKFISNYTVCPEILPAIRPFSNFNNIEKDEFCKQLDQINIKRKANENLNQQKLKIHKNMNYENKKKEITHIENIGDINNNLEYKENINHTKNSILYEDDEYEFVTFF